MPTVTDLFNDISKLVCNYCDRPDAVIRVQMNFETGSLVLKVVRHIRDPADIFDNSGDVEQQLAEADFATVKAKATEYFALTQQWEGRQQLTTTLSVSQDGSWSMGGTSRTR